MIARLRRLARVLLPKRGKHHDPPARRAKPFPVPVSDDEQWIRDLLPPTPRAPEPAEAAPWAPRITRWIRLVCPLPDDTILLSPIPAATVLEFMGRGFLWDPDR